MINNPNQGDVQFTWQTMLWRLLLTALLLLVLLGSGLTFFSTLTTHPDTQVLPTLTYEARIGR